MNGGAHQGWVGRPDNHPVWGVNIGQDDVGQMFDVIEKFPPGVGPGHRIDVGKIPVFARVEQLAHGPHVRDCNVADFGGGDCLNEL
ncbi:hypothetical protein D3C81_2176330 [compost metagenome]